MESSFDCYTPLERPGPPPVLQSSAPLAAPEREDGECDSDSSDSAATLESSDDSDTKVAPIHQRTILPRRKRPPTAPSVPSGGVGEQVHQQQQSTRKKYDIWTEKIREDSLTETMRNFGVNREGGDGRNIEWYDYTLTNRFAKDGKTNRLKRRRQSGGEERQYQQDAEEDDDDNSMDMDCSGGKRVCYNNRKHNRARILEDLVVVDAEASSEEVAKELAQKLKESNEALILQLTMVLGREFVQSIYKETQRIEEDGGMMIRNNRRRRTSGGVFLFLVKHNDEIGEEKKREAFKPIVDSAEDTSKRDEEIEELKKTLITQDSPKLRPKLDSIRTQDMSSTLSNPPPSPVAPADVPDADEDPNNNKNDTSNSGEQERTNACGEVGMNNEHMDFN